MSPPQQAMTPSGKERAMMTTHDSPVHPLPPPIVYTIAGSDSGGGAGIQADLLAAHAMGCHGCSVITCLTAQNSCGVTDVHVPPPTFLKTQFDTLVDDLPPVAIKIGMLGTTELAEAVGDMLKSLRDARKVKMPWVVFDPVMISTSGHKLIDDDAKQAIISQIFPVTDVLTPNKYEAEELLGRKLLTPADVEQGAKELLQMGVKSVLIKGGHSLMEGRALTFDADVNSTVGYAQDYFLSSPRGDKEAEAEPRLCDGCRGVWIRSDRYDSVHTHGTGCTLSSAIASALALGQQQRDATTGPKEGATTAIYEVDAVCLAKAYVTAGIGRGMGLGKGPGPVVHTAFPSSYRHYPSIVINPTISSQPAFRSMKSATDSQSKDDRPTLGRILPIVDSQEWVERLLEVKDQGIKDIQLRIKNEDDPEKILGCVKTCQERCQKAGVRLWINDYWKEAVEAGCFGVHIGQEDLYKCERDGGLDVLRSKNMALGISTHSYGELSVALAMRPSYISMGPVFGTASKKVNFDAQGLGTVRKWRQLIPPSVPFMVIGGIGDATKAREAKAAGAESVAVIGAIMGAGNLADAVRELNDAMR